MKTEFTINPQSGEMVVRGADEALLTHLQDYLGPDYDVDCGQSQPIPAKHSSTGSIRIASIIHGSMVDGPGLRSVAFLQGCPHQCDGCHSPHTHSFDGGVGMMVHEVVDELLRPDIARDGITLSGGDPMAQPEACSEIVRLVKEPGVHSIVYTGFTYEQLLRAKQPAIAKVLALADVLVDGPFVAALRDESLAYCGSTNQRAIDLAKTRETVMLHLADWD